MRGTRAISCALAGLVLGACGTSAKPSTVSPTAPPGNSRAVGVTVDLGTDPRLAPVERLLSASKGTLNAGLFLSAFDVTAQPCNIAALAVRLGGRASDPPLDVAAARVVSVQSSGNTGSVELTDTHPYYVRLSQIRGKWVVNENACLWLSEVDGGTLPASATGNLAELGPDDPRRVPPAALINSLTHRFDASTFLSAFDLSDQPCDVRALARSLTNQATTDNSTNVTPRFFLQPVGRGEAGVLASAEGEVLPMRIRQSNGRWQLDEDACVWLTLLAGAQLRAQDRSVQSDLRNALTAEKTLYTDTQAYSSSPTELKRIEPSLDWGNRLQINVADAQAPHDANVVCLSESSASDATYSIADIAAGPQAGTYYAPKPCPSPLTPTSASRLGNSFEPAA